MNYANGQPVAVGDRVKLWDSRHGTVVCSIDTDEFSKCYPQSQWGYLGSGVIIKSDSGDVYHYTEPDEDFEFIQPATSLRVTPSE